MYLKLNLSISCRVLLGSLPSAPTHLAVSDVTSSSALVTWQADTTGYVSVEGFLFEFKAASAMGYTRVGRLLHKRSQV